eukprot:4813868-Pyramimonas_sp.AAC.1
MSSTKGFHFTDLMGTLDEFSSRRVPGPLRPVQAYPDSQIFSNGVYLELAHTGPLEPGLSAHVLNAV